MRVLNISNQRKRPIKVNKKEIQWQGEADDWFMVADTEKRLPLKSCFSAWKEPNYPTLENEFEDLRGNVQAAKEDENHEKW